MQCIVINSITECALVWLQKSPWHVLKAKYSRSEKDCTHSTIPIQYNTAHVLVLTVCTMWRQNLTRLTPSLLNWLFLLLRNILLNKYSCYALWPPKTNTQREVDFEPYQKMKACAYIHFANYISFKPDECGRTKQIMSNRLKLMAVKQENLRCKIFKLISFSFLSKCRYQITLGISVLLLSDYHCQQ